MDKQDFRQTVCRVEKMETYFDMLQDAANLAPERLREEPMKEKLQVLTQYYESGQWMHDYTLDETGILPAYMKRGVLSEDGVYNLLAQIASIGDID